MSSVLSHLFRLLIARLGLLLVSGDKRDAEIIALRHQILVLQRQIEHPRFTPADRTILAVLSRAFDRRRLNGVMLIVKAATVIGWHRRLVARHWTQPPQPRTGRPATPAEIRRLVHRLDTENSTWGYRRIHGELRRLGHHIAASTVWKILRDNGREPTPNRVLAVVTLLLYRFVYLGKPLLDEWHCSKGETPLEFRDGGRACLRKDGDLPAGAARDPLGNRPLS